MGAVGLWAWLVGGRAVWALAPRVHRGDGPRRGLGLQELGLPGVEAAVALSVVFLGLAVGLKLPLAVAAGAAVCGAFALFHGLAHGAELPARAEIPVYMLGFGVATALLHAAGIGFGIASPCPNACGCPV
jgi:urease accessory protein